MTTRDATSTSLAPAPLNEGLVPPGNKLGRRPWRRMSPALVCAVLAALDLTDTGARTNEDIFTGPSQWMPLGRVFGGQVLAQSLLAAMRTTADDRFVHSMHGYFLRPGDVNLPINFGNQIVPIFTKLGLLEEKGSHRRVAAVLAYLNTTTSRS